MLYQRLRRWHSIEPASNEYMAFILYEYQIHISHNIRVSIVLYSSECGTSLYGVDKIFINSMLTILLYTRMLITSGDNWAISETALCKLILLDNNIIIMLSSHAQQYLRLLRLLSSDYPDYILSLCIIMYPDWGGRGG